MANSPGDIIHHTERVQVPTKYIVMLHDEDYQVFELADNGIYRFYANTGYSYAIARDIAKVMNEKDNGV